MIRRGASAHVIRQLSRIHAYALTFLQAAMKVPWATAYTVMAIALLITTPLFLFLGHLSDRIGRKKIMLTGCALRARTCVPIYIGMKHFSNPTGLAAADPALINVPALIALVSIQMAYVCMVYGPIAAFLVESFPTQSRYTSMSVPHHLGNGWFGGFLPLIATWVTASEWAKNTFGSGAVFADLIYPIEVCVMTLIIGGYYLRETKDHHIDAQTHAR